jgi:hypothetical protein
MPHKYTDRSLLSVNAAAGQEKELRKGAKKKAPPRAAPSVAWIAASHSGFGYR